MVTVPGVCPPANNAQILTTLISVVEETAGAIFYVETHYHQDIIVYRNPYGLVSKYASKVVK